MNDLTADLMNAKELLSACEVLKEIEAFLENNTKKRSAFCKSLSAELRMQAARVLSAYRNKDWPYTLCDDFFSVVLYLVSHGIAAGGVRETRANIQKQIEYIDRNITKPSGNCLTATQAGEALSAIAERYPYFDIVGKNKPLVILSLDNSHRKYNSFCAFGESAEQCILLMYHMRKGEAALSPVYVFLHELGHALQVAMTGSQEPPPEFFEPHSFFSNVPEPGNPDAADVFADTFAIAMMRGSPLSSHSPFDFGDATEEAIERFIRMLMRRYAG